MKRKDWQRHLYKTAEALCAGGIAAFPAIVNADEERPLARWLRDFGGRIPTKEDLMFMPWWAANAVMIRPGPALAVIDDGLGLHLPEYLERHGIKTHVHRSRGRFRRHAYFRPREPLPCSTLYIDGRQVGRLCTGDNCLVTYISPWHSPLPEYNIRAVEIDDLPGLIRNWLGSRGTVRAFPEREYRQHSRVDLQKGCAKP